MITGENAVSFRRFLKEPGMGWMLTAPLLGLSLVIAILHAVEFFLFPANDRPAGFWFHLFRDFILVIGIVLWTVWTLFEYRKKFRKTIARQESQFLRLLSAADETVILSGAEGTITFWNPAAEKLLGWTEMEALGRKLEEVVQFPALQEGRDSVQECRDRNGKMLVVNVSELILNSEEGKRELKAVIMRDLSQWLVHNAQMERSERLASLGHMAAGVAHEIGNPLASISGIIQLLQRRSQDLYVQEQLTRVRQNIDRITKIVRDMVDFSRAKSPEPARVMIEEIVQNAVGLIKHDARCRNIRFDIQFPPNFPPVKAVADQLTQVFINLLLNAVDAFEDQPLPGIRITGVQEATGVQVMVEDNGKGILPAVQSRIFEPFFTTKEPGKGTGLGLSVVYHILQSNGGSITVRSKPGETIFTLHFSAIK